VAARTAVCHPEADASEVLVILVVVLFLRAVEGVFLNSILGIRVFSVGCGPTLDESFTA